MYNPTNTKIHPVYAIYNDSPTSSLLLIKIFPSELLYSGTIEPNKLLGQVRLSYTLTDITDPQKTVVADSGRVTYSFTRENADKRFMTQLPFSTQTGKRYQLAVMAHDVVRKSENLAYMYVDRTSDYSAQNFLITTTDDNAVFYEPYVIGNSTIQFRYYFQGRDTIFVKYYGKKFPLPRPSFSMSREKEYFERPDSIWKFPFSKNVHYRFNYEGVFYLQPDTNVAAGLTLMNFGENFPKVQDVRQLIEPLAYLATSTEYDNLDKATNQKLAVDNFWLDKAGNIEKARELIKVYYNRVYFANYYFTSYKPGWETDRGMIFIIYGPPQSVKVTPTQEKWIYYKNNFSTMVTFTFDYSPTQYSADEYTLQRSDSYDTYWRSAVETWRKGNIYLIK